MYTILAEFNKPCLGVATKVENDSAKHQHLNGKIKKKEKRKDDISTHQGNDGGMSENEAKFSKAVELRENNEKDLRWQDHERDSFDNLKTDVEVIAELGAIRILITTMVVYSDFPDRQEKICRALWKLSKKRCANKSQIVMLNGIARVCSAMILHTNSPQVQEEACGLLGQIAFNDIASTTKIVNAEGISLIIQAMKRHITHAGVQKRGCSALCNISFKNDVYSRIIIDSGGLDLIFETIKTHPEIHISLKSLHLLQNLLAANCDSRLIFLKENRLEGFATCMDMFSNEISIQLISCNILKILNQAGEGKPLDVRMFIHLLVKGTKNFMNDPTYIGKVTSLLYDLSSSLKQKKSWNLINGWYEDESLAQMINVGVVEQLTFALGAHIADDELRKIICKTLCNLKTPKGVRELKKYISRKTLEKMKEQYPDEYAFIS